MTNKQKAKLLRDLANVYITYDKICDLDKSYDKWCNKFDKLFLKLLDLVVEDCEESFKGNLFKRLSEVSIAVVNDKGEIL